MKYLIIKSKELELKAKEGVELIDAISEAVDLIKYHNIKNIDLWYGNYLFGVDKDTDLEEIKRMINEYNNRYAIAAGIKKRYEKK